MTPTRIVAGLLVLLVIGLLIWKPWKRAPKKQLPPRPDFPAEILYRSMHLYLNSVYLGIFDEYWLGEYIGRGEEAEANIGLKIEEAMQGATDLAGQPAT